MKDQVLPKATLDLLARIDPTSLPEQTYLAGGTACALWFGHRLSKDLDFFVGNEFVVDQWRQKWESELGFKMFNQDWQTLEGEVRGVKLAMFYYKYPLIEPPEPFKNIKIAKLKDLAAMKLEAIVNRGTKRDFVDLYFLIKQFGLRNMFAYYDSKYGNLEERELLLKKALIYFDEAEEDEMPNMVIPTDWDKIKKYLEKEVL